MHVYSLEHRPNAELRRDLEARFASERVETAGLVVHIAEFDARGLYKEAGFDSMREYCMKIGRLSEDAAFRRLHAARAVKRYPCLFQELVDGAAQPFCRLHPGPAPDAGKRGRVRRRREASFQCADPGTGRDTSAPRGRRGASGRRHPRRGGRSSCSIRASSRNPPPCRARGHRTPRCGRRVRRSRRAHSRSAPRGRGEARRSADAPMTAHAWTDPPWGAGLLCPRPERARTRA